MIIVALIHKFGGRENGEEVGDIDAYVEEVRRALPSGLRAKGDLYRKGDITIHFYDRTQSHFMIERTHNTHCDSE